MSESKKKEKEKKKKKDKDKDKDKDGGEKEKRKEKKKDKKKDKEKGKDKDKDAKDKDVKDKDGKDKDGKEKDNEASNDERPKNNGFEIAVSMGAARNLKSRKGGDAKLNSFGQFQSPLDEAPATSSVVHDSKTPNYELTKHYQNLVVDEYLIQTLVDNPLVFSVYESEKKAGKTLLGTATLPWDDFLRGETTVERWIPLELEPEHQSEVSEVPEDDKKPEISVFVACSGEMLSKAQWNQSKIVSVFIDGAFSLPARWLSSPLENNPFAYEVRMDVPVTEDADRTLTFEDGTMQLPGDDPSPNQSRCIKWQSSYRCFVGSKAMQRWQNLAAAGKPMTLGFRRSIAPRFEGTVDPNEHRYRATMSMDISGLLIPGNTSVTSRCTLKPLGAEEDVADAVSFDGTSKGGSRKEQKRTKDKDKKSSKKKKDKEKKVEKIAKKHPKGKKGKERVSVEVETEEEGAPHPYESAGTYVMATLVFDRPVVPKPPTPKPVYRVKDFLPQREPLPRPPRASLQAKEEFKAAVSSVTKTVVEEYKKMYSEEMLTGGLATPAERKRRFIEELKTGGSYFAFKEQLKQSVVRIVREKFQKTSPIAARHENSTFLNDLYMYVIDYMEEVINVDFKDVEGVGIPKVVDDEETLLRYAEEAEVCHDMPLAARHYQERITIDRTSVEYWYDYAKFCLRISDWHKADECLREAINLEDGHVPSLLTYGVLSVTREKFAQAETFLAAAAEAGEHNPDVLDERAEAWAVLSLLFDILEKDDEEEAAQEKALAIEAEYRELVREQGERYVSLYVRTARRLLDLHLVAMAERALGRDLLEAGEQTVEARLCLGEMAVVNAGLADNAAEDDDDAARAGQARAKAVAFYGRAEQYMRGVAEDDTATVQQRVRARVQLGHILYLSLGEEEQGRQMSLQAYETALQMAEENPGLADRKDVLAGYLRLGGMYDLLGDHVSAKATYMKACRLSPSAHTWLGVGAACYRLGEYHEAESALSEANILNNLDPDVWAYLVLVSLRQEHFDEADQAMSQALKLEIQHPEILTEIGACYASLERYEDAEQCLLHSLRIQDDLHTRRLLADVLADLQRVDEAEVAFQEVASADSAIIEDRVHAYERLCDIAEARGDREAMEDCEAAVKVLEEARARDAAPES